MPDYLNKKMRLEIEKAVQQLSSAAQTQPGLSLGIKTAWQNRFGIDEEILLFAQADWLLGTMPSSDAWQGLRLGHLRQILTLKKCSPAEVNVLLQDSACFYSAQIVSAYALLHAAHPAPYTCFCEPPLLLADIAPDKDKIALKNAIRLPFEPDLFTLARHVERQAEDDRAFIFEFRGVLLAASTLDACLNDAASLIQAAGSPEPDERMEDQKEIAASLPELREWLSARRGRPLVLQTDSSPTMQSLASSQDAKTLASRGLPFPDYFSLCGQPNLVEGVIEQNEEPAAESRVNTAVLLKSGLGVIAAASSLAEARRTAELFHHAAANLQMASPSLLSRSPDPAQLQEASAWEPCQPLDHLPFAGEIALVTGAASGIGKAIVEALLRRGSAVAGVDINPSILTTFQHPSYRGFVCDVSDEPQVMKTIREVAGWAGGLDMLILNAGMFPSGCDIKKMPLAEFSRVIDVNFIANMVLMREAHPLLCRAPRYGRVVMIGSRNMRAPGPGASAYSTSKAALTQLARVAALEWSSDRIRVNVIHPDSVFDTGLYTEEVLKARSAHYGLTVEQYKKRNLLKVEITSHDVAELTAEMCGPLFSNVTGGQIQFDGGNDRTL